MAFISETVPFTRGILSTLWHRYNVVSSQTITRKHHCETGANDTNPDIVILGSGMVGTALAVALG